jgi:hypothetical protein
VSENRNVDIEKLVEMSPEEQKQYLGELIYPGVVAQDEQNAGKITGMLLELNNQQLLHLLDDNRQLQAKIWFVLTIFSCFLFSEVQNVLREVQNNQTPRPRQNPTQAGMYGTSHPIRASMLGQPNLQIPKSVHKKKNDFFFFFFFC